MEGQDDTPIWLQELERKVHETYSEILKTSIERGKHHKDAAEALDNAVSMVQKMTLEYLEQMRKYGEEDFEY